ncbi:hypothetical protein I5S62_01030 [Pseudomonas putida]|uniref:hypothetical protein n=1 Tax=Pseudomonas putida TaxID=303 RepID=UPI0018DA060B|nr:hypothetical protein [Pseudomonas putida]MBH3387698.1 hypothetical protein [Pseudomonas putida]
MTLKPNTQLGFFVFATGPFFKACRLLRFIKRKFSRMLRKWFVYLVVAGLAGNYSRLVDHFSIWKPWRLAKGVAAYLIAS